MCWRFTKKDHNAAALDVGVVDRWSWSHARGAGESFRLRCLDLGFFSSFLYYARVMFLVLLDWSSLQNYELQKNQNGGSFLKFDSYKKITFVLFLSISSRSTL